MLDFLLPFHIQLSSLSLAFAVIVVLYCLSRSIYNVWFHPLAGFPGPKLAAATRWYEGYFDIFVGSGGQYFRQIERMHQHYGLNTTSSYRGC